MRHHRDTSRSRWPVSSVQTLLHPPFPGERVCVSSVRPPFRHALNFVHICFPDRSDSHFFLFFFLQVALLDNGGPFMRLPISGSASPPPSSPLVPPINKGDARGRRGAFSITRARPSVRARPPVRPSARHGILGSSAAGLIPPGLTGHESRLNLHSINHAPLHISRYFLVCRGRWCLSVSSASRFQAQVRN